MIDDTEHTIKCIGNVFEFIVMYTHQLNIELIELNTHSWIGVSLWKEKRNDLFVFSADALSHWGMCIFVYCFFFLYSIKSICFNWQALSDSLWRLERRIVQLNNAQNTQLFPTLLNLKCDNFLDFSNVCRLFIYLFRHCSFVEKSKPQKELFRPKSSPMLGVKHCCQTGAHTRTRRWLCEILCLFNYCQQQAIGTAC